jgi:hypothetical protein
MSTNNFLKGINTKKFFDGFVPLKPKTYCVIIIYDNGNRKEIYSIENPWQYMAVLRKNPRIKSCYIKDENNG